MSNGTASETNRITQPPPTPDIVDIYVVLCEIRDGLNSSKPRKKKGASKKRPALHPLRHANLPPLEKPDIRWEFGQPPHPTTRKDVPTSLAYNHRKAWSPECDHYILRWAAEGKTAVEIGLVIGRTAPSVWQRLAAMGVNRRMVAFLGYETAAARLVDQGLLKPLVR